MAARRSFTGRFGRRRVEARFIPAVKSHTPECAKIEQFAASLASVKSYHFCVQDFKTNLAEFTVHSSIRVHNTGFEVKQTRPMTEEELVEWLNALAELGFIRRWFWAEFGGGPPRRVSYLINGRTYSYVEAVQLVRDFEIPGVTNR
jgi:hypothetical protein